MSDAPARESAEELLFPPLPYSVEARAERALGDAQLQRFVNGATRLKDATRERVRDATFGPDAAALRAYAGRLKGHVLDHLDTYLERFAAAASARGTQVHAAADAEEARRIVVDIATRAGARRCVKTKSMVTEEIRLNAALERAGVRTVETDLGEYILQLDHDAPSHIVTPMIHKDRTAVGRAFTRELGAAYTEDPDALTAIARRELREAFHGADLAVTGGNFLVAEDGAVVICTNEGNGRMCATWPRVRVAVVGIEKLVPDRAALAVMLDLLARTSTGQPLTVYTSIVAGPRRPGEADGPEELHVVLLDNGRSDVLADPEVREALRCIRCGACLNACPVYRKIGGHAYGAVYPGPIGAVLTPLLRGVERYPDLPQASSLCGACHAACPVDIDLPRMLVALRGRHVRARRVGWRERLVYRLWAWGLRGRWRYRVGAWVMRWVLRRRADARGFVTRLPGPGR
ncbi:MAG: iron-sulfur cluster-binding protein, partial [Deltaproteobacteria bacterium]